MTNDNNTRKKFNAIFFATIMVISMVAIGFAGFAGSAAAQESGNLHADDTQIAPGERTVYTDDDAFTQNVVLNVTVNATETANYTVDISDSLGNDVNVTGATASSADAGLAASADLDQDAEEVTVTVNDDDSSDTTGTVTVALTLDATETELTDDRVAHVISDEDEDVQLTLRYKVVEQSTTVISETGADDVAWQGETITFIAGADDTVVRIYDDDDGSLGDRVAQVGTTPGQAANFDTSNLDGGDYIVQFRRDGTETDRVNLELEPLDLQATADETEITTDDTLDVSVTSEDVTGSTVEAVVYDADEDSVATDSDELDGSGNADFSFSGLDEGTYTVEVTHEPSEVTAMTEEVTVSEAPDGDIAFAEQVINSNQGSIAEVTIEFTDGAEEASLRIGDEADVGYEIDLNVESGGEDNVTVYFNTYAAGDETADDEDVVWVDEDSDATVDVVDQSTITGILDQGDYEMELIAGVDNFDEIDEDNADTVGTLIIEDRSTDSLDLWTAPSGTDLADGDEITAAVEDEVLTQTDTVAGDDLLVHELGATGLDGMLHTYDDDFLAAALAEGDNGTDLRIRQTAASTGPNQDRKVVNVSASEDAFEVVTVDDTYYIVLDASSDELELTDDTREIEDGDVFDVRLRVVDERLLDPDTDEEEEASDLYQSLTAQFTYEDATGDFDDDEIEVLAEDDQQITGTTNVAPGNEFNLRVRSASGVQPGFIKTTSVTVDADRTFAGAFDFSETSVDDEFTVSVRQAPFSASADGMVVDAEEEETPTETEEPDTPTEEPDTPTEEPDTPTEEPDTPTETEDETPGFGVVVALFALIAAALLATRRQAFGN